MEKPWQQKFCLPERYTWEDRGCSLPTATVKERNYFNDASCWWPVSRDLLDVILLCIAHQWQKLRNVLGGFSYWEPSFPLQKDFAAALKHQVHWPVRHIILSLRCRDKFGYYMFIRRKYRIDICIDISTNNRRAMDGLSKALFAYVLGRWTFKALPRWTSCIGTQYCPNVNIFQDALLP